MWSIVRGVGIWCIRKSCNEHYIEEQQWSHLAVVNKVWAHIRTYIKKEWRRLLAKVKIEAITIEATITQMQDLFG